MLLRHPVIGGRARITSIPGAKNFLPQIGWFISGMGSFLNWPYEIYNHPQKKVASPPSPQKITPGSELNTAQLG